MTMTIAPGSSHIPLHNLILLLSRLLLASIFVHEGVFLIANFTTAAPGMAKLGIPPLLAIATIALQLAAGLAIAFGVQLRPAAVALGLFCVATAVLFHTNLANRNELLHFEKDLAIAGGLFALAVCGTGRWTIAALWRTRTTHAIVTPHAVREPAAPE